MGRIDKRCAVLQCHMDESWPFHSRPFLLDWSVFPERNPSLFSLAEHKASRQHFGKKENWGLTVQYTDFHLKPPYIQFVATYDLSPPWCLTALQCKSFLDQLHQGHGLGFLPWSTGMLLLCSFCILSACSHMFHSTPYPQLLRFLVHSTPEQFQNSAVPSNVLFVDSSPYNLKFHSYSDAVPQRPFVYSLLSFQTVVDICSPMSSLLFV